MSKKNKNKIVATPESVWRQRCAESNGTMIAVPSGMEVATTEFQKKSEAFIGKAREFDKLNVEFDVYAKNFWFAMRQAIEKIGDEDIFTKNIGWNELAKKEGVSIINLSSANKPQPMKM